MDMERETTDVEAALAAIESAKLTPTEHLLLKSFVKEAVDPSHAAQHILQRLSKHANLSSEEVLRGFKQDWRRLVVKCKLPVRSSHGSIHRQLSDNIPVSAVVEVPAKAEVSLRNRDGSHCCMTARPRKDTGNVEAAFIIPPTLFEDHELHPRVNNCTIYTLLKLILTCSCSAQGLLNYAHGGILDS